MSKTTETETTAPDPQAETVKTAFDEGLELYQKKAPYDEVISAFEKALDQYTKDSSGFTCLAWLHLLRNEPGDAEKGYQLAKTASKMDQRNSQAHFNMILGMLMTSRTGVRQEIQKVLQKCQSEELHEAIENLKEALQRRPEFPEASKLLAWLAG